MSRFSDLVGGKKEVAPTPVVEEAPRPEEEIADDWFEKDTYASRHKSTPDHEKSAEEIVTMHEKMYREATKNGKHTLGGGSEEQQSRG